MNKSQNYCQPPPPPCHCHHHHPPPPKLVNGYPRWNRHRRLYRSHLRMNNVDWASDDEEEPVYQYHYQYPYHYQYHYPCNNEQQMEDEYSYDSYPVPSSDSGCTSTTSSHTSTSSTKSKSTKSTKKTKSTKNTCKTDTSGRWTATNDEKWTIASNNNDEEDCSCISGETNLSHDVHNYIVG